MNQKYRLEIDNLRKEKLVFETLHGRMEKNLQAKRKSMAEIIEVADGGGSQRRARFAVRKFELVGCELFSSSAEFEVVESELIGAPIDPDVLRSAADVSAALAAAAINASNFACVRLNTVWKAESRNAANCAILSVTGM